MAKACAQFSAASLRRHTLPLFIYDSVTIYCVNNFYKLYVWQGTRKYKQTSNKKREKQKQIRISVLKKAKEVTIITCICYCSACIFCQQHTFCCAHTRNCVYCCHIFALRPSYSGLHTCAYTYKSMWPIAHTHRHLTGEP